MNRYSGHQVTIDIEGAHPKMPKYPLIEDDLVVQNDDGTWDKLCPGIGINGFILTQEQEATLTHVEYSCDGLAFQVFDL